MRHPPAWGTARFLRRSSSGLRQAFVASLLGEFCYLIVNLLDFQGHAYVVRMLREETEQQISFRLDRKSTRLNSSHVEISYAVFCLKKKKKKIIEIESYSTRNSIPDLTL